MKRDFLWRSRFELSMKSKLRGWSTVVFLFLAVPSLYSFSPNDLSKRPKILILNSYHQGYRFSDEMTGSFCRKLRQSLPEADIRVEYMDTKRYEDRRHFELFFSYLSQKYSGERFDLILASDDAAFLFTREFEKRLWPGAPVVFCGLNYFDPEMIQGYPQYTGIIEKSDIEENVRLIERLHPDARTLYLIIDNTINGEALRKSESALIQKITRFEVRVLDGKLMDFGQLLDALAHLPKDAVVIYQLWLRDRTMRVYEHEEVLPLICQHSTAPVYGFSDIYLGLGIVGGKLISGAEQGTVSADMALRILSGTEPNSIPVQLDSHSAYRFDYVALRRFHIPIKELPTGSEIINRPVTFYGRHRRVLWVALGVCGVQLLLIFHLLISRRNLRKTEKALKREHQLLQALMDNMPDHIYFKDRESRFIRNNKAHLDLFKVQGQEDTLGKTDFDFFSREFAEEAFRDEQEIIATGEPLINKVEKIRAGENGSIWVSCTKVPIRDETGYVSAIVGISRDITQSVLDAQQIRESLYEKEVLLKEIHHRVKNNLQIITSLLNLQMSDVRDESILDVLRESQHRIRSMALIHEYLYRGEDLGRLDMKAYIRGLVNGLYQGYQKSSGKVAFHLDIQDAPIPVDLAIPCGLILNELLSNSLKYAFSDDASGREAAIQVRLSADENHWVHLNVEDNGKGMPDGFDWKKADSLGLKLVRILAENQLGGSLNIVNHEGTRIEIHFPVEGSEKSKKNP
jgi:two-component system cell cycle sensor histidine kinase/response regulator CckA